MNLRFEGAARGLIVAVLTTVAVGPTAAAGDERAAAPAGAAAVEEVRQVEARRYDAMVRGDLAALGELLAEDLTYTHSHGGVETKEQFLANLESGALRYRSISTDAVAIRVYGEAAVVTGAAVLEVTVGGREVTAPARFTAVYARADGRWRLVAWQSTARPAAPRP
jgi:uncharacterized protein (TIGR02246 family)